MISVIRFKRREYVQINRRRLRREMEKYWICDCGPRRRLVLFPSASFSLRSSTHQLASATSSSRKSLRDKTQQRAHTHVHSIERFTTRIFSIARGGRWTCVWGGTRHTPRLMLYLHVGENLQPSTHSIFSLHTCYFSLLQRAFFVFYFFSPSLLSVSFSFVYPQAQCILRG